MKFWRRANPDPCFSLLLSHRCGNTNKMNYMSFTDLTTSVLLMCIEHHDNSKKALKFLKRWYRSPLELTNIKPLQRLWVRGLGQRTGGTLPNPSHHAPPACEKYLRGCVVGTLDGDAHATKEAMRIDCSLPHWELTLVLANVLPRLVAALAEICV